MFKITVHPVPGEQPPDFTLANRRPVKDPGFGHSAKYQVTIQRQCGKQKRPHCWKMIFESRFPQAQGTPEWFRAKVARMFSLVEKALQPLAKNHTSEEIAQAARALWSGVHGTCILAITNKLDVAGVASVQDLAQSLMSNYLAVLIVETKQ